VSAFVPALQLCREYYEGPVDQFRDLLWPAAHRRSLLRLFDPG
jgi:hypothetical protein